MNIELINTGTELMVGRVLNLHQQWLCRQLADRGYVVTRQTAVPDTGPAICTTVTEALDRADAVITTGGLGPTSDDLTRGLVAEMLGCPLVEDPVLVQHIEAFFRARGRAMPSRTRIQAQVPRGARVLANPHGTAAGLAMRVDRAPSRAPSLDGDRAPTELAPAKQPRWLIMLPGPPRELRPMFAEQVVPLLSEVLPLSGDYACRVLKTIGIGESALEELVDEPLRPLCTRGLELGYCARVGEVEVRLTARGDKAEVRIEEAEHRVRSVAGKWIYGTDDDTLEAAIVRGLTSRGRTLALAESCTGGFVAHRLTNVPGASKVLLAGFVTYSNASKVACLGVRTDTLSNAGAVSEETACEMATGARVRAAADYALSVTGIAGPDGGSIEKPVGTVFIALASSEGVSAKRFLNPYDRETFKEVTARQALDMLRRVLVKV